MLPRYLTAIILLSAVTLGLLRVPLFNPEIPPPTIQNLMDRQEEFVYDVHYGFMRLGEVRLFAVRDTVYNGKQAYYYRTEIESNSSIPFVGYKEIHYHSIFAINDTIPYGLKFWSDKIHRDVPNEYVYKFDYDAMKVFSFFEGEPEDTLQIDQLGDSGPAFFFYSRLHAGLNRDVSYPIYIDDEPGMVHLSYKDKKQTLRSPAFGSRSVEVYPATGSADFEGPFGFSGDFSAYFNVDRCRTPVEARVRVWVGSVRVQLREVNRL